MLAIPQHGRPVHQHVPDATRVLVRLREGGVVLDRGRIEDHHIREVAGAQRPAAVQLEVGGGAATAADSAISSSVAAKQPY